MKPQGAIIPPQAAPVTEDAPGLFSRAWYLCLVSIAQRLQVLKNAVLGWGNLVHARAIPIVLSNGTLGESLLTDDGSAAYYLTGRSLIVEKAGEASVFATSTDATGNANYRLRNSGTGQWLIQLQGFVSNTLQIYDEKSGTQKMSIATGASGVVLMPENVGVGALQTNAQYPLDAKGDINATGKYRVGGTQVVGPRGGAIAVPTGGGTAVTAPAGGTVIDVQARNAIAVLIAAVGSGGNSVDPNARAAINSIINALSSASGHGLIT